MTNKKQLDGNLPLEMARVTEAAAISAARYMGVGNKEAGDQAAVNAMRTVLKDIDIKGTIVIGEGEKDNAPMLFNGERVGSGWGPEVDIAVDPVEGTNLLAKGMSNAVAVLAITERGGMWNPGRSFYMNKIVVEKKARDAIDITRSPSDNLRAIAKALNKDVRNLTVFILEKERHQAMIEEIRDLGSRITLHTDGDVMGALLAAIPGTDIDVLMGIGGTPEGVISATAIKALGAGMQGMRAPQLEEEKENLRQAGVDLDEILGVNDLVKPEEAFFAVTGITGGTFISGVNFDKNIGITTHSITMRATTGSIRFIKGIHQLKKLSY